MHEIVGVVYVKAQQQSKGKRKEKHEGEKLVECSEKDYRGNTVERSKMRRMTPRFKQKYENMFEEWKKRWHVGEESQRVEMPLDDKQFRLEEEAML